MKNISNKEIVCEKIIALSGETYYITSTQTKDIFFIYKQIDSGYEKLGKGQNPIDLENKYINEEDLLLSRLEDLED